MNRPIKITTLLLFLTLTACWDSYVNKKEGPKRPVLKKTDSIQKDSSIKVNPNPSKKKNKALDTLKPYTAINNFSV